MVDGLNEAVKNLALTGIKQRNPTATPEQIHRMLADLMLGEELARKVYDRARGSHPHYPSRYADP